VNGVVVQTAHLSHFIEEFGWWISRRGRPIVLSWWCAKITDNTHRAKLPEKQSNINYQGKIAS
jgi:hypothetical protein